MGHTDSESIGGGNEIDSDSVPATSRPNFRIPITSTAPPPYVDDEFTPRFSVTQNVRSGGTRELDDDGVSEGSIHSYDHQYDLTPGYGDASAALTAKPVIKVDESTIITARDETLASLDSSTSFKNSALSPASNHAVDTLGEKERAAYFKSNNVYILTVTNMVKQQRSNLINQQLNMRCFRMLVFALISFPFVGLYLYYSFDGLGYEIDSFADALAGVISLCTIALLICVFEYYYILCRIQEKALHLPRGALSMWKSESVGTMLLELILIAIHVPPFLGKWIPNQIQLVVVIRLYMIIRYLKVSNVLVGCMEKFRASQDELVLRESTMKVMAREANEVVNPEVLKANVEGSGNVLLQPPVDPSKLEVNDDDSDDDDEDSNPFAVGIESLSNLSTKGWRVNSKNQINVIFVLRNITAKYPVSTMFFVFIIVYAICGFLFYTVQRDTDPFNYNLANSYWLMITTMLTVGYGDYVPSSTACRIIVLISGWLGMLTLSVFVSSFDNMFQMSRAETSAHHWYLKERFLRNAKACAVSLIAMWWRQLRKVSNRPLSFADLVKSFSLSDHRRWQLLKNDFKKWRQNLYDVDYSNDSFVADVIETVDELEDKFFNTLGKMERLQDKSQQEFLQILERSTKEMQIEEENILSECFDKILIQQEWIDSVLRSKAKIMCQDKLMAVG